MFSCDVLKSELDGAVLPIFKMKINFAAPDEGGEEADTVEYVPVCPKCGRILDNERFKFCPDCGTKLWWHIKYPGVKRAN